MWLRSNSYVNMVYVFIVWYFVPGITNEYFYWVDILLTYASFQQQRAIWANKSNLTLSILIESPVPIQQSEQSCNLCVNDIDFAFSYDFIRFFFRRGILGKDLLHCRGSLNNFSYSKKKHDLKIVFKELHLLIILGMNTIIQWL